MTGRNVFINCPFSSDYLLLFRSVVFAVIRSGFTARCALETDDGSENRFDKICKIIKDCSFGVHDISMTELDHVSHLPRFNMPLELGLFLAAKKFGSGPQKRKKCLIFDKQQHRYQAFISDISGHDIHAHSGSPETAIAEVAAWLRDIGPSPEIPGGVAIASEFQQFMQDLPSICASKSLQPSELTYQDYRAMASQWIVTS